MRKTSYVCLPCGAPYKVPHDRKKQICPRCTESLIHGGSAVAAPPPRDNAAWRMLSFLLNAGVRFQKRLGYLSPIEFEEKHYAARQRPNERTNLKPRQPVLAS
ncbi:hypothetical protein ACFU9X_41565 [Streptomyces atratus]|uniref:hypothetical protein n=1 Tax=Streptomyces atratus TaxID=1893 RepID=UPI0036B85D5F